MVHDSNGRKMVEKLGPFKVGDDLSATCVTVGGKFDIIVAVFAHKCNAVSIVVALAVGLVVALAVGLVVAVVVDVVVAVVIAVVIGNDISATRVSVRDLTFVVIF